MIKQAEGSIYCHAHIVTEYKVKERELDNYRLQKWQHRVSEMSNSDGVKSLRDEIGILRMMLEEKINSMNDATDLLLNSHVIGDLILKIEKIVVSCHRLDKSMGQLIGRSDVVNIASEIVTLLEEELKGIPNGHTIIGKIADRIEVAVSRTAALEESDEY
jgi:hypothetical protein